LKRKLDERETRDKLISRRNDIIEAKKRVNYRNHSERIENEIQRDNLAHNSLEHLQHQINEFKNLKFT
jgi:predicted translin family RNA/ssDNA-binding protein